MYIDHHALHCKLHYLCIKKKKQNEKEKNEEKKKLIDKIYVELYMITTYSLHLQTGHRK